MKRAVILTGWIILLSANISVAGFLGDIDQDGEIGLTEAINALQITSGMKSPRSASYIIVWRGAWEKGEEYRKYDAVEYEGSSYICVQVHTSSESDAPPSNLWEIMALKGEKGEIGTPILSLSGSDAYYTDGNVGIGTTTPAHRLDVEGDINAGNYNISGETILAGSGENIFLGAGAGENNTGTGNTFIGNDAGHDNQGDTASGEGNLNTFVGYRAGWKNTIGARNTYIGYNAGSNNTQGSNNIFLGYYAGHNETGSNRLYIDNSGADNPLIYGEFDNHILSVNGNVGINTRNIGGYSLYVAGHAFTTGIWEGSDKRWKKNICPIRNALEKILQINGVRYEWNQEEYPDMGFSEGEQIGLVAQEVETVIPEIVRTDQDGYKSVAYERLAPVLLEAIKEQQAQIEGLKAQIEELKREISEK